MSNDAPLSSIDFISRANSDYIEYLYEKYQEDPRALDKSWHAFFAGFELGNGHHKAATLQEQEIEEGSAMGAGKGVYGLVNSYRHFGHLIAKLDPLGHNRESHPYLTLSEFGLTPEDLELNVGSGGFMGKTDGTLRDLLEKLRETYCGTLGVEYRLIADINQRTWLQEKMELDLNKPKLTAEDKKSILQSIIAADEFEQYLHTNYLGQKRFSIEGGDSAIPLLNTLVEVGAEFGVDEVVMGMAHRGRINVLAHILHKPYEMILSEFEGSVSAELGQGDGDVKYHSGYSHDHVTSKGKNIHVSLSYNPSHLELVNPAIQGIVRAKQEYRNDVYRTHVIPILIHGDAAFTGQGIVPETLSLSELEGYETGGTIHVIVNNQLGFTAMPRETRFTPYPTDVAKMIQAPVFHVNADDPEAVFHAAQLAMVYRNRFKADVMIDLVCYRRYGHNESDDPFFTQPLMYKQINEHPRCCEIYAKKLVEEGVVNAEEVEAMRLDVRQKLDRAREIAPDIKPIDRVSAFGGLWKGFNYAGSDWTAKTAVPLDALKKICEKATRIPANFSIYKKLQRLLESRKKMVDGDMPVDWGCGEMLAFGSLLLEGISVRLSGQDCGRGTFSHRHAIWYDTETGEKYVPLANLEKNQPQFNVLNSMLSEEAVLGFEYGVSLTNPNRLVIWEAQFGDFVNGAQAIVDEFIFSAEAKWKRMNGLVMLLPHGYEGQGPDHSSARPERFLSLCAENNVQVCIPTTPSQIFHLLRRQIHRKFRKPLVVMSPKSLLRHKRATSDIKEFVNSEFRLVIGDDVIDPEKTTRVLLCTGKVYFDLLEKREELNLDNVAIIRIEQLYPFPEKELLETLKPYINAKNIFWVQEEPRNMGAWYFVAPRLRPMLKRSQMGFLGRDEAASPATGSHAVHQWEQKRLIADAFAGLVESE